MSDSKKFQGSSAIETVLNYDPSRVKTGNLSQMQILRLAEFGGRDQQAGDWWEAEMVRTVNPQIVDVKVTTLMSL